MSSIESKQLNLMNQVINDLESLPLKYEEFYKDNGWLDDAPNPENFTRVRYWWMNVLEDSPYTQGIQELAGWNSADDLKKAREAWNPTKKKKSKELKKKMKEENQKLKEENEKLKKQKKKVKKENQKLKEEIEKLKQLLQNVQKSDHSEGEEEEGDECEDCGFTFEYNARGQLVCDCDACSDEESNHPNHLSRADMLAMQPPKLRVYDFDYTTFPSQPCSPVNLSDSSDEE